MKKRIFASCLILLSFNSHAFLIKAEDTADKFIRIQNFNKEQIYKVDSCILTDNSNFSCSPLVPGKDYISGEELKKLSNKNLFNAGIASAGLIAVPLALTYIGGIALLAYGTNILLYEGAAAALVGSTGLAAGAATGLSFNLAYYNADPAMHRDISIALEAASTEGYQEDLEDVDVYQLHNETVAVIEDINFEQLSSKLKTQLEKRMQKKDFILKNQNNPKIPWQLIH